MLPQDRWPEQVGDAYPRAAVQQFLDDAEAARVHLEAAVDVAHQRRRLLQVELAEVVERNARLARELVDTAREIRTDRNSQANAVAVVLAAAEAEAAARLARAHEDAARILSGLGPAGQDDLPGPVLTLVAEDDDPRFADPSRLVG